MANPFVSTGYSNVVPQRAAIAGLSEFEGKLAQLRNLYDVKTGGVIIRALMAAAQVVKASAKAKAPKLDPNFAAIDHAARLKAWEEEKAARKAGRGRRRGKLGAKPTRALIKANIVAHPIPVKSRLAGGLPTVLVRVRNRGYTRRYSLANLRGEIRWNRPGSSPGYWWWIEFGTSRFPAKPFMTPAFNETVQKQLEEFKDYMRKEIKAISDNRGALTGAQLTALRKA